MLSVAPRSRPPLLKAVHQWERLKLKIEEAGGCNWCLVSTYEYDPIVANRWAEETGLCNGLVLTRNANEGGQGPHVFRWVAGVPIHAKAVLSQCQNGLVVQIGSANLTKTGLMGRGYRDVVWTEKFDTASPDTGIVRDLVEWFLEVLEKGGLERKIPDFAKWTTRLKKILPKLRSGKLQRSGLWHNFRRPLIQEMKETTGKLRWAWIMTPYVHPAVIKQLPLQTRVVLPANKEERKIQGQKDEFNKIRHQFFTRKDDTGEVFTHAKIYLLQGRRSFFAWGSANCTMAGLMKKGATMFGPRTVSHELLAWKEITKKEATQLRKLMIQGIEKMGPDIQTTKETELESMPEEPELLAWGQGQLLEVVLTAGIPPVGPIRLIRNRRTVERIPTNLKRLWNQQLRPKDPAWGQVSTNNADEWEVAWGKSGPVKVIFLTEAQAEKDLSYLWGGVRSEEPDAGKDTTLEKSSSSELQKGKFMARLDDYENRSRKVANNLSRDITSFSQELEPIFGRLWKEKPDLGASLSDLAIEGARLFLCARLLAILEKDGVDQTTYAELRSVLNRAIQSLCQQLPSPERRAFLKKGKGWRDIHAWTSSKRKLR